MTLMVPPFFGFHFGRGWVTFIMEAKIIHFFVSKKSDKSKGVNNSLHSDLIMYCNNISLSYSNDFRICFCFFVASF